MIFLMTLSWSYNLSVADLPGNFFNSTLSNQNQDINQETNLTFIEPYKIAIKDGDTVYSGNYSKLNIVATYDLIKSNIITSFSDYTFKISSKETFSQVFESDNFIYLDFSAPISAIANIDSQMYISEILIKGTTMYIKSFDSYYTSPIEALDIEIPSFLDSKAYFEKANDGNYVLLTNSLTNLNTIEINPLVLDENIKSSIIAEFFYNLFLVDSYDLEGYETVFINEYSQITITPDYIEFVSYDTQGNIYTQEDMTSPEMLNTANTLFNDIYAIIGSAINARPADIYSYENQIIVVLDGVINSVGYNYDEYAAIFSFTQTGISYAKINLVYADVLQEYTSPQKANSLPISDSFVLKYSENGSLIYKKIISEVLKWIISICV